MRDIGISIRMLREAAKETQQELADAVGITASHMSLLESGSRNVSLDILVGISRRYGVSLDYIVFGETNSVENDENLERFLRMARKYPREQVEKSLQMAEYYLKVTEE